MGGHKQFQSCFSNVCLPKLHWWMLMLRSRDFNAGTCPESLFAWPLESWNIIWMSDILCRNLREAKAATHELFQVYGTTSGEICGHNQGHFTHETEPVTITLQVLSGGKAGQVCFTLRLRDQRSMRMPNGCKVYMDSYMASSGSCFMVTWTIFENHLL